ncbi:hypothetical protein [Mycoplasma elephantis]|uniref:hypothetical protein n=1 Tax=Mycoplasma elephantis TaxID=114882 RepID=UPI000480F971|nr:hypothetical protein [Mycoplasma elephantis]
MDIKNLTTLTPIKLNKTFKNDYNIKNFMETIFIITQDNHYYYYCLAIESSKKIQLANGIWIEKENGMDQNEEQKNFRCYYFMNLDSIYRISKNELEKYVLRKSDTIINWETQLDIVVKIDDLVNSKNKIHIVVVDNVRKNILTIN